MNDAWLYEGITIEKRSAAGPADGGVGVATRRRSLTNRLISPASTRHSPSMFSRIRTAEPAI